MEGAVYDQFRTSRVRGSVFRCRRKPLGRSPAVSQSFLPGHGGAARPVRSERRAGLQRRIKESEGASECLLGQRDSFPSKSNWGGSKSWKQSYANRFSEYRLPPAQSPIFASG